MIDDADGFAIAAVILIAPHLHMAIGLPIAAIFLFLAWRELQRTDRNM